MPSTDHIAFARANPPTPVTHRWIFLVIVGASLLLIDIDDSMLYTTLPVLYEQLRTTELEGLWIINAHSLVVSALLLDTGALGDRIGRHKIFLVGLTILGFSSLIVAFAPHTWVLVVARGCLRLDAVAMMPVTPALLRETFHHPRELATVTGIWSATAALGAAAGPVVNGFLLERFWWSSVSLINIPVAVFAITGTLIFTPPNQPSTAKRWDSLTSLRTMLAMLGLASLIKELAGHRSSTVIVTAIACGLVGAVSSRCCQIRPTKPLIDFSVSRSPMFSGGMLTAMLAVFVLTGVELMTAQRFQVSVGYTPLDADLLVATAALASLPVGVIGGMVLHRVDFRTFIIGGFFLNVVGLTGMYYDASSGDSPLMTMGLILPDTDAGSAMSISSITIVGSTLRSKVGMVVVIGSMSYEFDTLTTAVITDSFLPVSYVLFTPVDATISLTDTLHAPALNNGARAGLDSSYLVVLTILTTVAVIVMIAITVTLRGNPKETECTHE